MSDNGSEYVDRLGFVDLRSGTSTIDDIKEFLLHLHENHEEWLEHETKISPDEYKDYIRPAIHSLGGEGRTKRGMEREEWVEEQILAPLHETGHITYTDKTGDGRIDFVGSLEYMNQSSEEEGHTPKFALEVKGGEGNSEQVIEIPDNVDLAIVWSEQDIINDHGPAKRLNTVTNRVIRSGLNERSKEIAHARDTSPKDPDLFIRRDSIAGEMYDDEKYVLDVVVFPRQFPTIENPRPGIPNIREFPLAKYINEVYLESLEFADIINRHVWYCELDLFARKVEEDEEPELRVQKTFYNSVFPDIEIPTNSVEFFSDSEVEQKFLDEIDDPDYELLLERDPR